VDATDAVVESGEPYVILNNGLFEYTRGAGLSGIMYKWRVRNAYSDLIWGPYSPYRLFTPPAPTTVTVSPSSATMCPTGNLGVTATVTDQNGGVWTGGTVAWSSSNTSVATATSNGSRTANVAATGNGTATITATLDGVSGPSTVTVGACLAPPTSCTLDYIPTRTTCTCSGSTVMPVPPPKSGSCRMLAAGSSLRPPVRAQRTSSMLSDPACGMRECDT